MGKPAVHVLRAVLVVVLVGTVLIQVGMVRAPATDPEDGTLPLTAFSDAAFRYADVLIGAIVAVARRVHGCARCSPRPSPATGRRGGCGPSWTRSSDGRPAAVGAGPR